MCQESVRCIAIKRKLRKAVKLWKRYKTINPYVLMLTAPDEGVSGGGGGLGTHQTKDRKITSN